MTLKDRLVKLRRDNPLFTVAGLVEITLYGDQQDREGDFLAAAAHVLQCSQAQVDDALAFTGESQPGGGVAAQLTSGEPFTVADLKREIAALPDGMWVCVGATQGGPMRALLVERGAGEQFCLIGTGELKQT